MTVKPYLLAACLMVGSLQVATAQQNPAAQEQAGQFDNMLANRVEMELASRASLSGSNINVRVNNRTVTLTGSVAEQRDIERARRAALGVRGVRSVNANLAVKPVAVQNLSDEELAKQVAQRIKTQVFPEGKVEEQWFFGWEIEGDNWELEVEADDATIILEGEVDTEEQFRRVIEVARQTPGVRSVDASGLSIDREFFGYGYGVGYPYSYYGWGRPTYGY